MQAQQEVPLTASRKGGASPSHGVCSFVPPPPRLWMVLARVGPAVLTVFILAPRRFRCGQRRNVEPEQWKVILRVNNVLANADIDRGKSRGIKENIRN